MATIRAGRQDDFPRLAEIELDAFVVWAEVCGVSQQPVSAPVFLLEQSLDEGLLLVAEEAGRVVGFTLGLNEGGNLYVVELDVERAAQGRGIGTSLILALLDVGRKKGLADAVLTTDRYAPFNAPFYTKLGFRILEAEEMSVFLAERLRAQIDSGLDPKRRVAMLKKL
ncbi:GNAT family N-acetyltransferase [Agrobacterium sp. SORGH_AS 787]|uniref:GNAT family N-acetyltransferase n=1 Tax=Agrobacterium sp. SORGH_AS 787 TaxID=3041775 RepID=UPI00278331C7|nr:ribosomal protein S18 acetylase RimI-like enzyme [Rhizobium sp. SORGH_AS_0787]